MKPGYDSRPRVPAATPNSEAVSARIFDTVCGGDMRKSALREMATWVLQGMMGSTHASVVLEAVGDHGMDGHLPFISHVAYHIAGMCDGAALVKCLVGS